MPDLQTIRLVRMKSPTEAEYLSDFTMTISRLGV